MKIVIKLGRNENIWNINITELMIDVYPSLKTLGTRQFDS